MAAYLLFVPSTPLIDAPAHLVRLGLGELLSDGGPHWIGTRYEHAPGPDGEHPGVVLGIDRPPTDPRAARNVFVPGEQRWEPCKPARRPATGEAGRFWLGIELAAPPAPYDLQRSRFHGGPTVRLDDGQLWALPRPQLLPHECSIDPATGEDAWTLAAPFCDYAAKVAQVWDLMGQSLIALRRQRFSAEAFATVPQPTQEAMDLVRAALAINYVVNRDVIDFLGLVRTADAAFEAVAQILEFDAIIAADEARARGWNTIRYLQSQAWRQGVAPDHRPTLFDLQALAKG